MRRVLYCVGLILMVAIPAEPAQQVPGVQGCVGAGCNEPVAIPGVPGCVGLGCQPCDDKLLKELKAKRAQKIKTYREIVAAAEETRQREGEALNEAKKVFSDYTKDVATKGATTVAKNTYPVPTEVYEKYKKYKQMAGGASSTEDLLKLAQLYLEELAKASGYEDAGARAKWVDAVISGIAMDAKMLTKLKEADFHSEQAFKQWLLGYEALMEARHLEDRIRKLEAECKRQNAPPQQTAPQEEQEEKTSGEREAEAAQRMVHGWRDVNGEIKNTEGSAMSEEEAFNEALSIVQGQSSQGILSQPMLATFTVPSSDMPFAHMAAASTYEAEWQRFRVPMRRAFEHLIQSVEAFVRAKSAFDRLGHGTGTSQSSQLQGSPTCVGMGCDDTQRKLQRPSP